MSPVGLWHALLLNRVQPRLEVVQAADRLSAAPPEQRQRLARTAQQEGPRALSGGAADAGQSAVSRMSTQPKTACAQVGSTNAWRTAAT